MISRAGPVSVPLCLPRLLRVNIQSLLFAGVYFWTLHRSGVNRDVICLSLPSFAFVSIVYIGMFGHYAVYRDGGEVRWAAVREGGGREVLGVGEGKGRRDKAQHVSTLFVFMSEEGWLSIALLFPFS